MADDRQQQVTRVPPFRPGDTVRVKSDCPDADLHSGLKRVTQITGAITGAAPDRVVWRIHFDDGTNVVAQWVERAKEVN